MLPLKVLHFSIEIAPFNRIRMSCHPFVEFVAICLHRIAERERNAAVRSERGTSNRNARLLRLSQRLGERRRADAVLRARSDLWRVDQLLI
jgi:hypothetical protein